MAEEDKNPAAAILQHPAQATHMALPAEVMNDLINAVGQKYFWLEIDPLMTKIKTGMQSLQISAEGDVAVIKRPVAPK